MPTTFPNMGLQLPVRGAPGSGAWGDTLDANIQTLDAHDHSEGLGPRINPDGIEIDEDLSFAGFSPTGVRSVAFSVGAAVTGARKVYVGASGDLYYNESTSGTAIQLTSGTSLNAAGFVGGIGGDYTAVSALLDYDDSTDAYRLRQQVSASVRQFAYSQCGGVILMEYKAAGNPTAPTSGVTLASPAALASPYTITMPAAAPGSTQLVQMSSAGVLTASNTVANAVTFSGAVTASSTVGVTGALTTNAISATTVTASGVITAQAGLTCSANQSVTLSGTGDLKHGSRTLYQSATGGVPISGTYSPVESSNAIGWLLETTSKVVFLPIYGLRDGDSVVSFTVTGSSVAEPTFAIYSQTQGVSTVRAHTSANTIVTNGFTTLTLNAAYVLAADHLWIKVTSGAGSFEIRQIATVYTHP